MVKIFRPNEQVPQGQGQLSLGTAAQAGRGSIAIGQTTANVGRRAQQTAVLSSAKQVASTVDREGKELFEQSKLAHQSALLLNKTSMDLDQLLQLDQWNVLFLVVPQL